MIAPSEKLYKIRPLKWHKHSNLYFQEYTAHVPAGRYIIRRARIDWDLRNPFEPWSLIYCVNDCYGEEEIQSTSLKDARTKAFADWCERIAPALIETSPEN